jgi:DNA-binding NarL/FixJ family response regulator
VIHDQSGLSVGIRTSKEAGMGHTHTIGVLIVDDHPLIRQMLAKLFDHADGLTTIATWRTVAQAIEAAALTRPDVVLMDLSLGQRLDGVAGTHQLVQSHPDTHVLILTAMPTLPATNALSAQARAGS